MAVPVNGLRDSQLLDNGADVTETVNMQQEGSLVAEAIAHLPGRCGEIDTHRAVQGLSYVDIAAKLFIAEATRGQVRRA